MEQSYRCEINIGGTYDRCLGCQYLGAGCSGPNTNLMDFERYVEWVRALRELRRSQGKPVSLMQMADGTDLSKNTIDNFFSGKIKDVSRTTMCRIEKYLIGGLSKSPCAMDLVSDRDIVYQDRPETVEALERSNKIIDDIHASYQKELEAVRDSYQKEMAVLREEAQRKIDHLLKENDRMDRIINKLLEK